MNREEIQQVCDEMREKWLRIGLSCDPCDFEAAKDAASRAYKQAGLEPPILFLLADSPVSCAVMSVVLKYVADMRAKVWAKVRDQVWDQVWDQVRAQVGAQVRDQVWDQVWDQVRAQVGAQVRDQVWDQVWDQVGAQVWDQVEDQVRDHVRDQVWDQVRAQVYGSHDANWLGFYDCIGSLGYINLVAPLKPLMDLAQVCGWWAPYENLCILQHRHTEVHFDKQNLLHNANGPAILYRDGFSVYAWHGVRIPGDWIEGNPPSVKDAITWENVEQRRAACEIVGWDKVLDEIGAEVIDKDPNPYFGELLVADLPDHGPQKFLRAKCGTGKTVFMLAHEDATTAREAGALSYGVPVNEYNPTVRT